MSRPSRNVDVQLLDAGRELYPETGMKALSVRKLADHAGVNLGMFHYHFRNKEAFVRALLQSLYESMFADLKFAAATPSQPVLALRNVLQVIARFARDNRRLLRRLLIDALQGEKAAVEFLRDNFPRHVAVVVALVTAGQRQGRLKAVPVAQAVMFLAGAVAAPILIGSAIAESGLAPAALAEGFQHDVLSDDALGERIDLALAGLALPQDSGA